MAVTTQTGAQGTGVPAFSIQKVVIIGVAFGSLIVVSDVYDSKTAMWIGVSIFTVMLFTTNMGSYLANVINNVSKSAVRT